MHNRLVGTTARSYCWELVQCRGTDHRRAGWWDAQIQCYLCQRCVGWWLWLEPFVFLASDSRARAEAKKEYSCSSQVSVIAWTWGKCLSENEWIGFDQWKANKSNKIICSPVDSWLTWALTFNIIRDCLNCYRTTVALSVSCAWRSQPHISFTNFTCSRTYPTSKLSM